MKFFIRSENDVKSVINRCHFENDQGRTLLAISRLQDLAEEVPHNAHILYAEGIIRRDSFGQGLRALSIFQKTYEYAKTINLKSTTGWLATFNATLLARSESEFRHLANLALAECPSNEKEDKNLLIGLLAELDRGVSYLNLLFLISEHTGESGASLEIILSTAGLDLETSSRIRKSRAIQLRILDEKNENLRLSMGETYPADERITLHEAIRELDVLLTTDKYDAEAWNYKAAWYALLDRYDDAIESADHAIELRPFRYARPHMNKALSLYRLDRCDEAMHCAKEALKQAELEGSVKEIEQARGFLLRNAQVRTSPSLNDLNPLIKKILSAAVHTSEREFGQIPPGVATKIIKRVLNFKETKRTKLIQGYIEIIAQLLADFTPETAFSIMLNLSKHSTNAVDYCLLATLYYATHSEGVQRRDAARFLVLMILYFQEENSIRQYYRCSVLATSKASTGKMVNLDAILREELGRVSPLFPKLIADQAPLTEAEIEQATRNILSYFTEISEQSNNERGFLMSLFSKIFSTKTSINCATCARAMQKVDVGKGFIQLSIDDRKAGIGAAEECWECRRMYCDVCYPLRQPNTCICGKGRDKVRSIDGVPFRGSLRLVKVRYN